MTMTRAAIYARTISGGRVKRSGDSIAVPAYPGASTHRSELSGGRAGEIRTRDPLNPIPTPVRLGRRLHVARSLALPRQPTNQPSRRRAMRRGGERREAQGEGAA